MWFLVNLSVEIIFELRCQESEWKQKHFENTVVYSLLWELLLEFK